MGERRVSGGCLAAWCGGTQRSGPQRTETQRRAERRSGARPNRTERSRARRSREERSATRSSPARRKFLRGRGVGRIREGAGAVRRNRGGLSTERHVHLGTGRSARRGAINRSGTRCPAEETCPTVSCDRSRPRGPTSDASHRNATRRPATRGADGVHLVPRRSEGRSWARKSRQDADFDEDRIHIRERLRM